MLVWRIYYGDSSTFDSSQGGPQDAPPWGVLCVVEPDPVTGRHIVADPQKGFFVWCDEHGEWDVKDYAGLLDFLAHFPGSVVRFGRGVPNAVFRTVLARANADPDFPKRSGRHAHEPV